MSSGPAGGVSVTIQPSCLSSSQQLAARKHLIRVVLSQIRFAGLLTSCPFSLPPISGGSPQRIVPAVNETLPAVVRRVELPPAADRGWVCLRVISACCCR